MIVNDIIIGKTLHFFGFCSFFYKFTKKVSTKGRKKQADKSEEHSAYGHKGKGEQRVDAKTVSEDLGLGYFSHGGNYDINYQQTEGKAALADGKGEKTPRQQHRACSENREKIYGGDCERHYQR